MEATTVLVLSADALAAALLGALIETQGYEPQFTRPGESARDALRRLRPRLALADCEYPDACSAAFVGPARMMGTGVVLFGRPALTGYVRECAELYKVTALVMPPTADELRRALVEAAR